jgi:hypothetical protein
LIVSLDDAPDAMAVDGAANMMTDFGRPYLIRVERHRDQYPASAGILGGGREPHPNMIAPTALHHRSPLSRAWSISFGVNRGQ